MQGQNLVPNGDFEQYDTCQTNISQLYRALHWTNPQQMTSQPYSTPDYFNACSPSPAIGVPTNWWGYEPAHSGFGYAAIGTAVVGPVNATLSDNYREYLQSDLTDTLIAGINYCVKFYVSACDSYNYVTNDMQVYFSKVQLHDTCHRCTLTYTPQFANTTDLSSPVGWTEVSGTYTAIGGEKFIVIGNFKDSIATVATYTGWTSNNGRNWAIYYVDDVSITQCDTTVGIVGDKQNLLFKVYPNPSSGFFYIELKNDETVNLEILDVLGNVIYHKADYRNKDSPINLTNYADGIYLLKVSLGSSSNQLKLIKN